MVETIRPSLARSLAITNVFDFLPENMVIQLQVLSKAIYQRMMPGYLGRVRLGSKANNKLFSYGVDDDFLWTFDCDSRKWSRVKAEFERLPENSANEPD